MRVNNTVGQKAMSTIAALSNTELVVARTIQFTFLVWLIIGVTIAVAAIRRRWHSRLWSAAVLLVASISMHRVYTTAIEDRFLAGIEAPLIEPWFFTQALVFTSFVTAGAFVARAMILKRSAGIIFFIGASVQLVAILNSGRFYFFIPTTLVSILIIVAVLGTAAVAGFDLRVRKKDDGEIRRPNNPLHGTPAKSPSSSTEPEGRRP